MDEHVIDSLECIWANFFKSTVALQRSGDRCERSFAFDLESPFQQTLKQFFRMHGSIRFAKELVGSLGHALAGVLTSPQKNLP